MKITRRILGSIVLFILMLAACQHASEETIVPVSGITLNLNTAELIVGETLQLQIQIEPANATETRVMWGSSKPSTATVSEMGLVTAVGEGTATITVSSGGRSAICTVTVVKAPVKVESITLSKESLALTKGQTVTLKATISPADATDKTITWMSMDEAVAQVSQEGKITAIGGGNTTITASAGGKSVDCEVVVTVPVETITLEKTEVTMVEGETLVLEVTVLPDDSSDKSVEWTSSDAEIATIDSEGKVTAVKEGSATITAEAGDKTASCTVTVSKKIIHVESISIDRPTLNIAVGAAETLIAMVLPDDATDKSFTWATTNATIAEVEQTGKVTAKATGTVTITATTADGGLVAACEVTVSVPYIEVTSITLDKDEVALEKGQSVTLIATVIPDNASVKTVSWTSSDTGVATVDKDGKVTAIAGGSATITATAGNCAATCTVIVIAAVPVTGVTLNKTTLGLIEGSSETLVATITPADATDTEVTWTSSDPNVSTVDQNGTVTAIAEGSSTITVTTNDGGKAAACAVTVSRQAVRVTGVELSRTLLSVIKGSTELLTATVLPENATDKGVTWSSSNTAVAEVDQDGNVIAKSEGTVTITATTVDGGFVAACEVTVSKPIVPVSSITLDKNTVTLQKDQTVNLIATVLPDNATVKTVTWISSDAAVATVTQDGLVAAVSAGTATITAAVEGKTTTCTVIVVKQDMMETVDLGLTVLWATCNVGASSPEEYGDYFAWGETEPYYSSQNALTWKEGKTAGYTWATYQWCNGSYNTLNKYNTSSSYGPLVDNKTTLEPADDAAYANWDGSWRMPTDAEWTELRTKCTWTWTRQYGIEGIRVTGPNGNVIFLPAAGYRIDANLGLGGSYGYYWSSSLNTDYPSDAWLVDFSSLSVRGYGSFRYVGRSIRPVMANPNSISVTGVELNTHNISLNVRDELTLTATLIPSNATNNSIVWASSNTAVLTVTSSGLIKAISSGTATITVTTADGGYTDSCVVEVVTPAPGMDNGHEWVDLGLPSGLKWATCNVGADTPEGYGDYYAWGETSTKNNYSWSTYKWADGSYKKLKKYNTSISYGSVDNKTVLDIGDDAARANWGGTWRIPTEADFEELINNCTTLWKSENGVLTWKYTSNINGNSIILPAAGYRSGTGLNYAGSRQYYWSSSIYTDYPYQALCLGSYTSYSSRSDGFQVRPVLDIIVPVSSITLNKSTLNLNEGESETLIATVKPNDATDKSVVWSSTNSSIATVDQAGRVLAKAAGTVTISATTVDGGFVSACEVTVSTPVTSIKLNKTTVKLQKDQTENLNATVLPENATVKTVTWTSSNSSVATVTQGGLVTALRAGTATITASSSDGAKTASCTVTVIPSQEHDGEENGHYYVDLGLPSGLKWATCNVGATFPEDNGDFFAWGETEPYYSSLSPLVWKTGKSRGYNVCSYRFASGSGWEYAQLSRYNTSRTWGLVDNRTTLLLSDDAARVNWGGSWRMPTDENWTELLEKCTFAGVYWGILVIGPNGNCIYLPSAGRRVDESAVQISDGFYWSSSLCHEQPCYALARKFSFNVPFMNKSFRSEGLLVRPVTE